MTDRAWKGSDPIFLEKRDDRIAVIALSRPQAMNAIDRAMTRALRDAIAEVEADETIDVLLLTGAGSRAFCAGIDLKERTRLTDAEAAAYRAEELFPMYRELDGRAKPAIAAVFGHTLAGGFELALACDLIVAAEGASFALPEVKWGLVPAAGGCRKLPALLGAARAKELIFTAKSLSAEEALRLGVINQVVPREELQAAALALARQILQNSQPAVRGAKRCIDEGLDARAACDFDVETANRCYRTRNLGGWHE
jgi:enoyl-CoA hydratase/carnithine racemase